MRFRAVGSIFLFVLGSCFVLAAQAGPQGAGKASAVKANAVAAKRTGTAKADFQRDVAPTLKKYCAGCHGEKMAIAGINLAAYPDEASVIKGRAVWENIATNVQTKQMPPKNMPQPTAAERALITSWIGSRLAKVDCGLKDPGRVTMRRLNRAEYSNTIRDLIGIEFQSGDDFPSDDVGYGFDNIGDVLSISPILMEKYLAAAEQIVEKAIVTEAALPTTRFQAERMPKETGGAGVLGESWRLLVSSGEVNAQFEFPKDGEYLLRARAWGQQAGPDPARMTFRLDGKDITTVDVPAVESEPKVYETKVQAQAGKRPLAVYFANDFYDPKSRDPKNRDRNLAVDYIEVVGPLDQKPGALPESHKRIFIVQPAKDASRDAKLDAARKILTSFARRAYRRPVKPQEVERMVRYVDMAQKEGDSFEKGIQLAVQSILVSPHFLFRVEVDANPHNAKVSRPLNDYELATRLSYFLWSSMPDDELLSLAAQGALRDPKALEAQARRMLKDKKSRALVKNFGGQWLTLRNLQNVNPDPARYPGFNNELRAAMLAETELFFRSVVNEDRSVLDFIDANYTFLNERLAKHYGIEGVAGDDFRRVALTGDQRGGLLTQASILTVTSNPTRTSPVKRGKWVLEQMLGTPPPPPPPDVPELKEDKDTKLVGSLRERMEQHRKDPGCASCHSRMDPIGFGFENFDAVGAWRTKEGEFAIDPSGTLPGGQSFQGPAELKKILKGQSKLFVKNLTNQMMTYALGRGLEYYDKCAADEIARTVSLKGNRFSAVVTEIVKSQPFRMRRGDGGEK